MLVAQKSRHRVCYLFIASRGFFGECITSIPRTDDQDHCERDGPEQSKPNGSLRGTIGVGAGIHSRRRVRHRVRSFRIRCSCGCDGSWEEPVGHHGSNRVVRTLSVRSTDDRWLPDDMEKICGKQDQRNPMPSNPPVRRYRRFGLFLVSATPFLWCCLQRQVRSQKEIYHETLAARRFPGIPPLAPSYNKGSCVSVAVVYCPRRG